MIMRAFLLYLHLFLITQNFVHAQDSTDYRWHKTQEIAVQKDAVWTVDLLGNVITSHNGTINKYDSLGILRFTQSSKSIGSTTQILAVNSMKLVHFSAEQQRICFYDNTLTMSESCIDLSEMGVYSAQLIYPSSRPDKLWIYDNTNSTLLLIDLFKQREQTLVSANLKGTLEIEKIEKMIECDSRLYLSDNESSVYLFDMYGTFIDRIEVKQMKSFTVMEKMLLLLTADGLQLIDTESGRRQTLKTPHSQIDAIHAANKSLFIQSGDFVYKYRLQF